MHPDLHLRLKFRDTEQALGNYKVLWYGESLSGVFFMETRIFANTLEKPSVG
jgi:hypothetical protein